MTRHSVVALLLVLALVVAGCAGGQSKAKAEEKIDTNAHSIHGAPPMPHWLETADPLIKTEYIWAAAHLDELQYIPCYCGCGPAGHTDNFGCYYQRDKNGTITDYDQMSFT